jgi:hypothetical protein
LKYFSIHIDFLIGAVMAGQNDALQGFIHGLVDRFIAYVHQKAQMHGSTKNQAERVLPQTLENFLNVLIPILNKVLNRAKSEHQNLQNLQQLQKLQELIDCLQQLKSDLPSQKYYGVYVKAQYNNQVFLQNVPPQMNPDGTYTRNIIDKDNGAIMGNATITETTDEAKKHKHFEISDVSTNNNVPFNDDQKMEFLEDTKKQLGNIEKRGYTTSATIDGSFVGREKGEKLDIDTAISVLSSQKKENELQQDNAQEKKSLDQDNSKTPTLTSNQRKRSLSSANDNIDQVKRLKPEDRPTQNNEGNRITLDDITNPVSNVGNAQDASTGKTSRQNVTQVGSFGSGNSQDYIDKEKNTDNKTSVSPKFDKENTRPNTPALGR